MGSNRSAPSQKEEKQREQPPDQQSATAISDQRISRREYFRALINLVLENQNRSLRLQCEMNRMGDRFLAKRAYTLAERTKKLAAVFKSLEAADKAIKAGSRQIELLGVEREATELDFERAAKALFDSAFKASFHTGRATAFLEAAIQSSRDGKRKESTRNQLAERDAAILKRAASFGNVSAEKIGVKLSFEFPLSHGTIARIVRAARNQDKNSRSQKPVLKKTGPRTRRPARASDLDPT